MFEAMGAFILKFLGSININIGNKTTNITITQNRNNLEDDKDKTP